jgi:hypothetical protein
MTNEQQSNFLKQLLILLGLVLAMSFSSSGQTPAYLKIEKLPLQGWSKQYRGETLSDKEKLERLNMLPTGERIEFESDYDEETDETYYYELSVSGLHYIDLDFDGDLDLLYSAQNGNMTQSATKVFYNEEGVLRHRTTLRDGILDIKKNTNNYEVYTLFQPCCDSYTTRIDQYNFSASDTAVFQESVSIIGRSYYPYKGMLDFETEKTIKLNGSSLYAFNTDIKHGYFRERNKEVRAKLKREHIIELHKIEGKVKAGILHVDDFRGEKYYLIITEPLNNLPKMPVSLYEWSQGDNRRLVGWVKAEDVN